MVLWVKIENLTAGQTMYDNWVCYLVPGWAYAQIAKLADDVPVNAVIHFRVSVTLATTADNSYMDKSNAEKVNLIAVQYNGPAPIPDNDGMYETPPKYDAAWPNDPYGDDDDPNY